MKSWWGLGEGWGYSGSELSLYKIQCPFCLEEGNFERAFHEEKKKPNSNKKINFDVYKCGNCAGYVHVLWSASESSYRNNGLHDYRVLPWPIGKIEAPEHWPDTVLDRCSKNGMKTRKNTLAEKPKLLRATYLKPKIWNFGRRRILKNMAFR